MRKDKQDRLEIKGWTIGTTQEFLGLSDEEAAYVELKLTLAEGWRERRLQRQLTQKDIARLLQSSPSRVAKMEAGDRLVSLDLLVRALLSLGLSSRELAGIVVGSERTRAG